MVLAEDHRATEASVNSEGERKGICSYKLHFEGYFQLNIESRESFPLAFFYVNYILIYDMSIFIKGV